MIKLRQQYPLILAECSIIKCKDGWYNMLNALCNSIQQYIDQSIVRNTRFLTHNKKVQEDSTYLTWEGKPFQIYDEIPVIVPQVIIKTIDVRQGLLILPHIGGDDTTEGMFHLAKSLATVTCEICGSPGTIRGGTSTRVRCDIHNTM